MEAERAILAAEVTERVLAVARALIAVASPNPPLSTEAVAARAAALVREHVPEAEVALHDGGEGVVNVVARLAGVGEGRRVVLSGHLDTYPVNEALPWTVDPLGGLVRDGRLYGRGAADMKGGIAASIVALSLLARHREAWRGEVVLALAGDEESMGARGTAHVLDTLPEKRADGVIIGDAGSPMTVAFGEKGFLWLRLEVEGSAAHGAHVHLGISAIKRLRQALDALDGLESMQAVAPMLVRQTIADGQDFLRREGRHDEAATLGRVTVNVGRIAGGISMNLVAAAASADVDIRLPIGLRLAEVEEAVAAMLLGVEGVRWCVVQRSQPRFTSPDAAITRAVLAAGEAVMGHPPTRAARIGASDARLFRAAGMPTVVYGPTPYNMGGADEYVLVNDLATVAKVHALASLQLLQLAEDAPFDVYQPRIFTKKEIARAIFYIEETQPSLLREMQDHDTGVNKLDNDGYKARSLRVFKLLIKFGISYSLSQTTMLMSQIRQEMFDRARIDSSRA